jgi:hypothetical protein
MRFLYRNQDGGWRLAYKPAQPVAAVPLKRLRSNFQSADPAPREEINGYAVSWETSE